MELAPARAGVDRCHKIFGQVSTGVTKIVGRCWQVSHVHTCTHNGPHKHARTHTHTQCHRKVHTWMWHYCLKKKNTSWTDGIPTAHDVQLRPAQSVLLLHGVKRHGALQKFHSSPKDQRNPNRSRWRCPTTTFISATSSTEGYCSAFGLLTHSVLMRPHTASVVER